MLKFSGIAYSNTGDDIWFEIKAKSEIEAKQKVRAKFKKRKKKIILSKIDLQYVEII